MTEQLWPLGDLAACLSEECSEVIKEHMKMIRFPNGSYEGLTPRDRWVQEIGDVLVSIDVLVRTGVVSEAELALARQRKTGKMVERYGWKAIGL